MAFGYKLVPQAGAGFVFGDFAAASSAATSIVVLSPTGYGRMLVVANSLNQPMQLVFGGTIGPELVPGLPLVLDLGANESIFLDASTPVRLFYCTATAPTAGRVQVSLL